MKRQPFQNQFGAQLWIHCQETLNKITNNPRKLIILNTFLENIHKFNLTEGRLYDVQPGELLFTCTMIYGKDASDAQRKYFSRTIADICISFNLKKRVSLNTTKIKVSHSNYQAQAPKIEKKLNQNVTTHIFKSNNTSDNTVKCQLNRVIKSNSIPMKDKELNLVVNNIQENKNIWFGKKWIDNFFEQLSIGHRNGHTIPHMVKTWINSKSYQLKASAFKVREYNFVKETERSKGINQALTYMKTGVLTKSTSQSTSRSDDIYKALQAMGNQTLTPITG